MYGASDGVITTFSVVAGAAGAGLGPLVAIVLGLANLVADGISMGAGNYLAMKSQLEQSGASVAEERPLRHGGAAFLAFVLAGAIPLGAYLAPRASLALAAALGALTLFGLGAMRARFLPRAWWKCGTEMLAVGGAAGVAAYVVGALVARLL